mmetsp:Transcript_29099/g.55175  ORF Transcript_29099/g.55175 Transcript_29099/m.55175 type:complete len:227 (+) Transcript_29099:245-925(+)
MITVAPTLLSLLSPFLILSHHRSVIRIYILSNGFQIIATTAIITVASPIEFDNTTFILYCCIANHPSAIVKVISERIFHPQQFGSSRTRIAEYGIHGTSIHQCKGICAVIRLQNSKSRIIIAYARILTRISSVTIRHLIDILLVNVLLPWTQTEISSFLLFEVILLLLLQVFLVGQEAHERLQKRKHISRIRNIRFLLVIIDQHSIEQSSSFGRSVGCRLDVQAGA